MPSSAWTVVLSSFGWGYLIGVTHVLAAVFFIVKVCSYACHQLIAGAHSGPYTPPICFEAIAIQMYESWIVLLEIRVLVVFNARRDGTHTGTDATTDRSAVCR